MRGQTAEELEARADRYEQLASEGGGGDDPEWLRRWAMRLRQLAKAKQRARRSKR